MFLIIVGGIVLFIITLINPFVILPIFIAGSYIEPMQFFPGLAQYNPTTFLGIVVFVGWFLHQASSPQTSKVKVSQVKIVWFFVIWMLISCLRYSETSIPVFITVARVLIPYFLFAYIVKTRRQISVAMWFFIIMGAISAFYGIYLFKANVGIYDRGIKRIVSFFDNPNAFGISLAILVPFVLGFVLHKKYTLRIKGILVGMLALITAGVVISYSRSGFIGFMAAIFLFVALFFKGEKKIVAGIIAIFCILVAIDLFPSHAKYTMWGRMRTITRAGSVEQIDTGRSETNKAGMKMMMKNPLFGVGLGRFSREYRRLASVSENISIVSEHALVAHNLYLQIGAQLGLVGLLIFFWIVVRVLLDLQYVKRILYDEQDTFYWGVAVGIQVCVVVFLLCGFMSGILFTKSFWMILPVSVSLKRIALETESERKNKKKNNRFGKRNTVA